MNCEIGIEWIGYTMICFGVANTIGSPISGVLGKRVGRPTLFIVATALNISALVAMELWHLARKQLIVFFVIQSGKHKAQVNVELIPYTGVKNLHHNQFLFIPITCTPIDINEHVLSLNLRHSGLPFIFILTSYGYTMYS